MSILNYTKHASKHMVRALSLGAVMLFWAGLFATVAGAVPVSGGNLSAIAGSPTLVTVVLQGGAKDPNLKVIEVQSTLIIFSNDSGDRISYRKADIEKIEVQGEMVEKRPAFESSTVALRAEDQAIVDQASNRVAELFQGSKDNQELRIWAAGNMGFNGNEEAVEYLNSLANANNMQTRLDAAQGLYLAGKPLPEGLIREGLASNNRNLKAQTAMLAGLFRNEEATPELMAMLSDRSAQFSAPAAVALARLGNREIISQLLDLLGSTIDEKYQAGVSALIILGGDDVAEAVKYRIEETDGLERFRLIYILHELGDPEGRKLLIEVFNDQLTIKPEAALILAADEYWDAIQYLQTRLKRREDPTMANLVYRARAAHAILMSGDRSAIHVFQSLLRHDSVDIKGVVLDLIADLADRSLLKLVQPLIRNYDEPLSLKACNTVLAIASPEYRERLQELIGKS